MASLKTVAAKARDLGKVSPPLNQQVSRERRNLATTTARE